MTQKQYSLADVIELQKHQGLSEEEVKEKLEAASLQPIPELRISEEEYRQVFGDKSSRNSRKRTKKILLLLVTQKLGVARKLIA